MIDIMFRRFNVFPRLREWADDRFGFTPPDSGTYYDPRPTWNKMTRQRIYHGDFGFWWRGVFIRVPANTSDGFTVYRWMTKFTFGWLKPFDTGLPAAMVHDFLCQNPRKEFIVPSDYIPHLRPLTADERALIFRDALRATEKVNRLREAILWRGVLLGTKYFGTCR